MKYLAIIPIILGAWLGVAPSALAETVQFHSAARPPTPLQVRLARERGTAIPMMPGDLISGELYRPAGEGPSPALVMLHGCRGRQLASEQQIAARFTALGYLVLAVDSFGPRGVREQCVGATAAIDRVADTHGALDWLASQPFVLPSRIALIGFSQGADVGLDIVSLSDDMTRTGGATFAAAILYYPYCTPTGAVVKIPTLILIGDSDDWASAKQCQAMMAQRTGAGATERLIVYPGVQHGFSYIELKDHAVTLYGHHMAYDEAADHAASDAAIAFLTEWIAR